MNEIDNLLRLVEPLQATLYGIALSSIRIYVVFGVLPATGEQFLQGLTRSGVVVLLGAYVAFGLPADALQGLSASQWAVLVVKEGLIGLLIGFSAATVFWVAESVGAYIDTQAGYNNVQLSNPLSGQQSTPVSNLLQQLVVAMFYTLGGMLVLLGALFESFKAWPLLSPLPSLSGVKEMVFLQQMDSMMTMVVKFAAPVLLVLVLIDLGFGLMTRAADKLEPSSLSQPVKGAVTMLLLALLIGVFLAQVRYALLPHDLVTNLKSLIPVR